MNMKTSPLSIDVYVAPMRPYTFPDQLRTNSYLLRNDWQISDKHRLSVRSTGYTWSNPFNNVTGTASPVCRRTRPANCNPENFHNRGMS